MSANLRPFRATLSLGNRKKSTGYRSGEYERQFTNPMFSQKPLYKRNGMRPCIIVERKPRPWLLQMEPVILSTFEHIKVQFTADNLTCRKKFLVD
ncbi:hypothetical protein AVEN_236602-1 [Araneus ventricosus]|uniref:Uncharacterized protein n=1 Tax=Araneus ventricosus TaxID=182803 RepID=A0A4Y2Q164_ARAVE|nr:hypothetical protein AVEN_236602-1 [Araneus ventricosus]